MKNIIIVGASRSGKSTLARRINKELNCFVISIDKLVAVFQNAYPELNIRLNWDRDKTTENIAPFLGHFLAMFSSSDGRGLLEYSHGVVENNRFVLEGAYYDFAKIEEALKDYGIENLKDRFHLIGLVQRKKTAEDFFRDFRKYDTESDWTFNLNDDELRAVAEDAVSFNQSMYEKLTSHGFDVYDTSENRDAILDEILKTVTES
ncbi:MAG: hypothetical protein J6Y08_05790 [Clostridiales bacterium]|nr:hypothetical protein [Clostridiales bacterium]